jgi:UPF0755 protein
MRESRTIEREDDRRGPNPRARQRSSLHRRRRRGCLLIAVVAFVVLVSALSAYVAARAYFGTGARGAAVTVTIPEGSSLREISQVLEKARVVRHAKAFELRANGDGLAGKLMPGVYELHVNEPYDDLVAALVEGAEPPTVSVTIPEGLTARQTATLLADRLPGFSAERYVDLTLRHPLPFTLPGYPGGSLEGFLFPATYDVAPDVSPQAFIRLQLKAFKATLAGIDLRKAHAHNLTDYDVTIIGSMVEREIQVADERPLSAAVMWNRLHLGMPLQIDATIQYALPAHKTELTYDDLKIQSPYNTYLHPGLPPTPIANPGEAALRAAARPAAVDYVYYVARGDGSGRHYFSSNYAQFLADKQRAQQ